MFVFVSKLACVHYDRDWVRADALVHPAHTLHYRVLCTAHGNVTSDDWMQPCAPCATTARNALPTYTRLITNIGRLREYVHACQRVTAYNTYSTVSGMRQDEYCQSSASLLISVPAISVACQCTKQTPLKFLCGDARCMLPTAPGPQYLSTLRPCTQAPLCLAA